MQVTMQVFILVAALTLIVQAGILVLFVEPIVSILYTSLYGNSCGAGSRPATRISAESFQASRKVGGPYGAFHNQARAR